MDDIGVGFDGLGNLDAFFQVVAAFSEFGAAHAEFDGAKGADSGADRLQDFDGETDAVFQGAAVSVAAVVEQGREELVNEPAVAAVDHDHFKTGTFGQACSVTIGFHDIVDQFLGQGFDRDAIGAYPFTGTPLAEPVLTAFVGHIGPGELARMG